jgi:hydrogenase nickel incorporation protein HypB
MCDTCGCGQSEKSVTISKPGATEEHHQHDHSHAHAHDHSHGHNHKHSDDQSRSGRTIKLEENILSKNNRLAERNRGFFKTKNIFTINLVSSPGAGKTTLLETTLKDLKITLPCAVIEGDQQTLRDAERIHATGVPVIQINTGTGCHLNSDMIQKAVKELNLKNNTLLFIENVGNLVCPALFDLGEALKAVMISVPEGDDKPLKYPTMFSVSDVCIINKIDLLPYVDFDLEKCKTFALQINPNIQFIEISAKSGDGMDIWKDWLVSHVKRN